MSATLNVTRNSFGIELRRGLFDIVADGRTIGSIERDESTYTSVDPGHHTIQIRAGRYCSPERSFDVAEGEAVSFRCFGAMIWPMYVASIVKPDLAISLKQQPTATPA